MSANILSKRFANAQLLKTWRAQSAVFKTWRGWGGVFPKSHIFALVAAALYKRFETRASCI